MDGELMEQFELRFSVSPSPLKIKANSLVIRVDVGETVEVSAETVD